MFSENLISLNGDLLFVESRAVIFTYYSITHDDRK